MSKNPSTLPEPSGDLEILHAFADRGVESQALSQYGNVTRVSIDPKPNDYSQTIQADVSDMPFSDSKMFDIGLFHPPCTKFSTMTSIDGDSSNHENLIPVARAAAKEYCDEYIIENKPSAPLRDSTTLSGKMFGLPIAYKRAFETSFDIERVPPESNIETEISPYFYSDRSRKWWCSVKGCSFDFPKQHVAKNALPSDYVHFLIRAYLRETNARDADNARSSHSDKKPDRLQ